MKRNFTKHELKCAYEICKLMEDHSANVLASGEKSESDKKWLRQSRTFVKAYESIEAGRIVSKGEGGSLGRALLIMDGISSSIKKLKH